MGTGVLSNAWDLEESGGVLPSLGTAALKIRVGVVVSVFACAEKVLVNELYRDSVFGGLFDGAGFTVGAEGREGVGACVGIPF
mmetsp:Transcript_122377/g.351640  ORF Transcript_122377/g.351640 Transcript_122377/m.351640 type:complete len:83 (+) Transcript_122377:242-490(+)